MDLLLRSVWTLDIVKYGQAGLLTLPGIGRWDTKKNAQYCPVWTGGTLGPCLMWSGRMLDIVQCDRWDTWYYTMWTGGTLDIVQCGQVGHLTLSCLERWDT